jgi:hypothetical protein
VQIVPEVFALVVIQHLLFFRLEVIHSVVEKGACLRHALLDHAFLILRGLQHWVDFEKEAIGANCDVLDKTVNLSVTAEDLFVLVEECHCLVSVEADTHSACRILLLFVHAQDELFKLGRCLVTVSDLL